MLRTIVSMSAAAILALTFLSACDVDLRGDGNATDDTVVTDDEDTDDAGAARTDDSELELVSDIIEVTIVDHEIEISETPSSGIVVFEVVNEGDETHGLAIEVPGENGDAGQILGTIIVEPGETEQMEVELESGQYIAFCPIEDHRESHGMETEFDVE